MLRKILALAVLLLASSITFAKDASADEQAIRALDTPWSHAAETKDLDKTVSFYADDASILPPNMPIAAGVHCVHKTTHA
jgi:ketosteroid isomerase-like protein